MASDERALIGQQVFDALLQHPHYVNDPHIREKIDQSFRVYLASPTGSDVHIPSATKVKKGKGKKSNGSKK